MKPSALIARCLKYQGPTCVETLSKGTATERVFITILFPETILIEEMQFQNGKSRWASRGVLGKGKRRQVPNNRTSSTNAEKWEGMQEGVRSREAP